MQKEFEYLLDYFQVKHLNERKMQIKLWNR